MGKALLCSSPRDTRSSAQYRLKFAAGVRFPLILLPLPSPAASLFRPPSRGQFLPKVARQRDVSTPSAESRLSSKIGEPTRQTLPLGARKATQCLGHAPLAQLIVRSFSFFDRVRQDAGCATRPQPPAPCRAHYASCVASLWSRSLFLRRTLSGFALEGLPADSFLFCRDIARCSLLAAQCSWIEGQKRSHDECEGESQSGNFAPETRRDYLFAPTA